MSFRIVTARAFREYFDSDGAMHVFASEVKLWKDGAGQHPMFGRDKPSVRPIIGVMPPNRLRHCHLRPINDPDDAVNWDRRHRRGVEKTSDRILFYVEEGKSILLLAIIDDPGAHELMRMQDDWARKQMEKFALLGERFLGSIVPVGVT